MGIFTYKIAGDVSILNKNLASFLKDNISPEEEVLFCLKSYLGNDALVALPSRIIILKMNPLGQHTVISFLYHDITSIEIEKGIMNSSLKIYTPIDDTHKKDALLRWLPAILNSEVYNSFSFDSLRLSTFLPYVEKIRTLVREHKKPSEGSNKKIRDNEVTKLNIAEQIEKLSSLRQSGALTEEEYLQAKKKILEA